MNSFHNCIHCKQCTNACVFLDQYQMDLEDFAHCPELAYHCFLCGECKRVCPKGIDGREIALMHRQTLVESGIQLQKEGYRLLLMEKTRYPFRNYPKIKCDSVFFPGCNFPGYYPKTVRLLSKQLFQLAGIPTAYDCCGKPIAELGLTEKANQITDRINQALCEIGAKELIVLCPNCRHYLQGKLEVPIVDIYTKLSQLGIGAPVDMHNASLFFPCPDRESQQIFGAMQPFIEGTPNPCRHQCCSAGGCASIQEPVLASQLKQAFTVDASRPLFTYCATCAGVLGNENIPVRQMLCEIMQTYEQPARGFRSVLNRAAFRFQ